MRSLGRAALAGVLLAAVCTLAAAEQFPLERVEVTDPDIPLLMMSASYSGPMPATALGLKGIPEGLGDKAAYYMVDIAGGELLLAYRPKPQPLLYADTDGDKDLSDEEPHKAPAPKRQRRSRGLFGLMRDPSEPPEVTFGPITVRTEGGGQAEIRVTMLTFGPDDAFVRVFPAYMLTGKINVGGRPYDVSFADTDCNGRFAESFEPGKGYRCDMMGIDLDRNGIVMPLGLPGAQSELLPVPRIISLGDRWYSLSIDPAVPALSMEEAEPEFGHLDLGDASVDVQLWSDSGIHALQAGKGPWRVPAGTYSAMTLELAARDEAGKEWTLSSRYASGDMGDFTVKPDATTTFRIGPPLTDKVTITGGGGMVSIGLAVVGQAGEEYGAGATRGREQQPAPKFRILDEAGDVLLASEFEYG